MSSFIYRYKSLSSLYCRFTQIKNPHFINEIEKRAGCDLFDYRRIAQPLPKCYYELCADNNCFGIGYSLRTYSESKQNYCNAMAEHGYFFGSYVSEQEKRTYASKIITFGSVRKKHIEAVVNNKVIYPIGPYIHYASDYYNEKQFAEVKNKLGKTLLVFFSHSGTGETVSFDIDTLIDRINSIKQYFDTVVISLFWSNLSPSIERRLLDEGYLVFSSGHRYDYYFLSRQKTMIKLADVTMSNSTGTHLAYCSYLNKPHWIVKQDVQYKALDEKGRANVAVGELMRRDVAHQRETDELYQVFANYSETLSSKQREVCNKYFGFDYVRTKEEIREIIK